MCLPALFALQLGSHSVIQTILELNTQPRLALNSGHLLALPKSPKLVEITGRHHQAQLPVYSAFKTQLMNDPCKERGAVVLSSGK